MRLTALAIAMAASMASPAVAQPIIDCPMRDAPFSTQLPLLDILLSPAAKSVVDREAPGLLKGEPQFLLSTKAPTFASILTLRSAATFGGKPMDDMAKLDAALATIPVTDAVRASRCARYDDERPQFAIPAGKPRILLFEKMTGFRDGPSVDAARGAFLDIAKQKGWAMVATDKGGAITRSNLSKFDAVIWNNVSGDVLTLTQRDALRNYIEQGGGFVAVHGSAGDPAYFWNWYRDSLIGATFIGHTFAPQFQAARLRIDDPAHPVAKKLPAEWTMTDEWYSFAASPRLNGAHVIATLDEKSYSQKGFGNQNLSMGDHPIAWTRCVGKGRSFYSAIGHRPETYSDPHYRIMLSSAIAWAAVGSKGKGDCSSPSKAAK